MRDYQKSGRHSSNELKEPPAFPPCGGVGEPLVNRLISHRKNPVKSLLLWPRAVKLERSFKKDFPGKRGDRSEISSFSQASKKRLKFTASNAFPSLVSQFGMTYHRKNPTGREVKTHLDTFLKSLRRKFSGVRYLWILEFQSRGTPHFHLFLSLPHDTPGLHSFMADTWHRIAEPSSRQHERFHHHEKNFIPWDMGSGSYLCKYLDKEHQKAVPEGFTGVGRFWASSRGLVPEPLKVEMSDIDAAFSYSTVDEETGEVQEFQASEYVTRQLCRHHEKSLRRSPWRSSARTRPTSYTLPAASPLYNQLESYLSRLRRPTAPPPF